MSNFIRFHQRLREKQQYVEARPVIYVAFGDSVTQGCMEYNTIEQDAVYHQYVKNELVKRYPNTILNVINSGVSAETAEQSRRRWKRDILQFQPDFVSISFGVNDAHEGREGLERYIHALRELVKLVREETDADLLLLTPNMMIMKENPNVHAADYPHLSTFYRTAAEGYLEDYVQALRAFAKEEQIPLVDVYAEFEKLAKSGQDIHTRLVNGINHPDREFHKTIAEKMVHLIMADVDDERSE